MTRISKKRFIEATEGSGGTQSMIAQKLGVTRQAVNIFCRKNPWTKEVLDEALSKIVDLAEHKLFQEVKNGQWRAIDKVLRTKGRDRGWNEKTDMHHSGLIKGKFDVNLAQLWEECKDGNKEIDEKSTQE